MKEMEIIQHQQIEGLTLFINTVDHRTTHMHSEWELIWILEESMSVVCDCECFQVASGQMVLFSPNEPHEFHKLDESCTFLCMQISTDILPFEPKIKVVDHFPHKWMEKDAYAALKKNLIRIMQQYLQRGEYYSLYCLGQSYLVLYQLLCKMPAKELTEEELAVIDKRNDRLERLLRFVDENYMHKIRLQDFARQEGCSMSYLSRFIKNVLNQTFQEYVTSVRFHCACKLISSENMRMLDVCMESGFSDYRYFSREFQKNYAMTPEQYRDHTKKQRLQSPEVRHSLHSVERFYTQEESLKIINQMMG